MRHLTCTVLKLGQSGIGHYSKLSPLGSASRLAHYKCCSRHDLKRLQQVPPPFRCHRGLTSTLHCCHITDFLAMVASVICQLQGAVHHTLTGVPAANPDEVTDTDVNREASTADILAAPRPFFERSFLPNPSNLSNFLLRFNPSTL